MKKNAKFIFRLVLLAAVVLLYFGAEALLPGGAQSTAAPQTQSAALTESTQGTAAESTPDGAAGTAQDAIEAAQAEEQPAAAAAAIDEDGIYDTKDEVALYIHTFGCLPGNYITKADARELGMHFIAAGHYATETFGVRALGDWLADRFGIEHVFVDLPNPV